MKNRRKLSALAVLLLLVALGSGCTLVSRLQARGELNKGVTAFKAQKYDEAEQHFKKAIQMDTELVPAYLYLAATYRVQFVPAAVNDPQNQEFANKAISAFQDVLKKDPKSSRAMQEIAALYYGLGQYEKAKDWQRKLASTEPSNADPYYGIGTIDYQVVSEMTGKDGDSVSEMTDEQKQQAQQLSDEGIEALNKALEIDPSYSDAMDYLNLLYRQKAYLSKDDAEKDDWLKKADQLALKALEIKRQKEREAEEARRSLFKQKGGKPAPGKEPAGN